MPAGAWLRRAERELPLVAELDPLLGPQDRSAGGVLVLAPHPDDESLGCGGLLAACAAAGRPVRVVVVSDGAGSHPNSRAWPRERLVALRQAEARAAVAALGLDPRRDIGFLGLPDTAVPTAGPAFEAALATVLAGPVPGAVFVTWQHDPHADHAASFVLAAAVLRALPVGTRFFAYPVWGLAHAHPIPGFPLPPEPLLPAPPRGLRLDVARHLPAKRRAVAAHASQTTPLIADDPDGFVLPQAALDLAFRPFELYLEATPTLPGATPTLPGATRAQPEAAPAPSEAASAPSAALPVPTETASAPSAALPVSSETASAPSEASPIPSGASPVTAEAPPVPSGASPASPTARPARPAATFTPPEATSAPPGATPAPPEAMRP